MSATPCIEIRRLSHRLPSGGRLLTILDSIDLAIPAGEFVAVLGPSGSGKSTLLALMAGLDRPTEGEIFLDGEPIHRLSEDRLARLRRRKVGFVFQAFQLLQNQTARENVLLPLELAGDPAPGPRADQILAQVGLAERGHHYPVQLSGGEQQRVALARAFASRPPILLADEPTGNLDPELTIEIMDLIASTATRGTTVIVATHDQGVVSRYGRRCVRLEGGRVVEDTPASGTGA